MSPACNSTDERLDKIIVLLSTLINRNSEIGAAMIASAAPLQPIREPEVLREPARRKR